VVVVRALAAARTQVSLLALAHDVARLCVEVAALGEGVARLCVAGAGARPAGDGGAQAGVTVVPLYARVTVVSSRKGVALQTGPGDGVAGVGVGVALAAAAVGEVPVAGLALVAAPPVRVGPTLALAVFKITEVVERAHRVALARVAAAGTLAVGARGAAVAFSPHHVALAGARAAQRGADVGLRSRGVTLACESLAVDVEADAVEMVLAAQLRNGALLAGVEAVPTAVVLELLAEAVALGGAAVEGQVLRPRDEQHGVNKDGGGRGVVGGLAVTELQAHLVALPFLQAKRGEQRLVPLVSPQGQHALVIDGPDVAAGSLGVHGTRTL